MFSFFCNIFAYIITIYIIIIFQTVKGNTQKIDQTKSKACSNITESTICHEHICPRTFEEAEETYLHNKEKEKKKKFRTTYILIFTIFSVVNIVVLLICVILSIKKKII